MIPSRAWIADFVGDRVVLVVGAGVVRSIICVIVVGSVLMCFCQLVVALVAVGFIVVKFTRTKHAPKTRYARLQCYFETN